MIKSFRDDGVVPQVRIDCEAAGECRHALEDARLGTAAAALAPDAQPRGLVVNIEVEGQFTAEFSGCGVDDADAQVADDHDDVTDSRPRCHLLPLGRAVMWRAQRFARGRNPHVPRMRLGTYPCARAFRASRPLL